MQVGVKGTPEQVAELTEKIGSLVELSELKITHLGSYDLIFDLDFDMDRMYWTDYLDLEDTPIILGTAGIQLEGLFSEYAVKPNSEIIGMNTLPTFINRDLAEVCLVHPDDQVIFEPNFFQIVP